ncbi:hypothetical protein GCM10009774_02090 [Cellulomonas gelida]|nr:hypothetical protein GCM10009774_02090 [Cellulomonas gelida]
MSGPATVRWGREKGSVSSVRLARGVMTVMAVPSGVERVELVRLVRPRASRRTRSDGTAELTGQGCAVRCRSGSDPVAATGVSA